MSYPVNTSGRPKIACEITADRVIAARVSSGQRALDVYSTRRLPSGAVLPNLSGTNILQPEAVRQATASTLEGISGSLRDVLLVIPDAAVRLLLLDFDDLPTKHEEAASVIRFRAKKSLPFDADSASLSFQTDRTRRPVKVTAAFAPRTAVEEYEQAVIDAGFNPGFVVPSIVATLGLVEVSRPTMVVKVDATTTTVSIIDGNSLILLRTLEAPGRTSLTLQDITSNVLPSMVFYEDTYSSKIDRLLLTGDADLMTLSSALQNETNIPVEALATERVGGAGLGDTLPASVLAAVAGGLLA
jgi:type IV pilus assembly protein PilM